MNSMKIVAKKIVVGVLLSATSVVGLAAFFQARDNKFGFELAEQTKKSYLEAQKQEYGDIFAQNKEKFELLMNEDKIASMEDLRRVKGENARLYDLISTNYNKNTRPLVSFENQIGEDKYYELEDIFSPVQLRQMKQEEMNRNFEKLKMKHGFSLYNDMREFDKYSLDFAKELRAFADKNKKRFKEGEALDVVASKIDYVDYLQILEQVIKKNIKEETNAKENTKEYAIAFANVADKYFGPAIWTANELSLKNKNFNIE